MSTQFPPWNIQFTFINSRSRKKSAVPNVLAEEETSLEVTVRLFWLKLSLSRPSPNHRMLGFHSCCTRFTSWSSLSLHTAWRGTAWASPSWWWGPPLWACRKATAASGRGRRGRTGGSGERSPAARWGHSNRAPACSPSDALRCSWSGHAWPCCPSGTWAHRNTARTGLKVTEVTYSAISWSDLLFCWWGATFLFISQHWMHPLSCYIFQLD